jgi:DNA-binding CsgD family transcriptional regulator
MSAPFVGRRRELGTLTGLIQRAIRERAPAAALVSGEPGSGKTRLLAEVVRETSVPRIVRLVGFEPMQQVPLGAAADLLRVLAMSPQEGAALERLVFGTDGGQAPDPLRIFEAAHRALSGSIGLLLAIDDLQWVDQRSVALVHYLLRSTAATRQPLAVIAVARPSPVTAAFRAGLLSDVEASRRELLDLGPLPLEDGRDLARALDDHLDETAAADLWRRASGSPFWVEALARSRAREQPTDLIRERLQDLGPDAGALLAVLAIAARPLTADELSVLQSWEIERVGQAARELVARGLALEASGTVRPTHDLIREATAAGLPPARQRKLHGRLADWIEIDAGDDLPLLREALAHRVAAGQSAVELGVRLSSSPGRRLMNGDDLRLLASISDGLDPAAAERITVDRAIAELAAGIGEVDLALERWSRVSEHSADPYERRDAETEAALVAYRFGRRTAAHDHLERARVLPTRGPEAAIRLDALEADVELWLDHETAAGSRTAQRALAAAEALVSSTGGLENLSKPARRAYLAALEVAIDGAMQEDRDNEIVGLAEQCMRVAAGLDEESYIASQIRAGQALRTFGRPREGEALDRRAWDASKRLVLPTLSVGAGRELARALRDLGHLDEAHAIAVETSALEARLSNAPKHWGSSPSMRHIIELVVGDSSAALRELRRDAAEEPDPHYSQDIHLAIAIWQARVAGARAASEVEAELAAAHADAELARCPRHLNGLTLLTAELLARIGSVDRAREALADWDRRTGTGSVSRDVWRLRAEAAIEAAEGHAEVAAELLDTYAQALESRALKLDLIWARIDVGRCIARVDRPRAIAAFTAAAELADECGAVSAQRLASQALRQLGVRAWRRGRAAVGEGVLGLSEREREVAELIADGNSNREVADLLVVSPKTVERHVTNILSKLGLRNRTELASHLLSTWVRGSPDE